MPWIKKKGRVASQSRYTMAWPNQDEHICGVAQAQQYRTAEADGDDYFLCDDSFFRGQVRPAFWCRCTALDPSEGEGGWPTPRARVTSVPADQPGESLIQSLSDGRPGRLHLT